jgi:copper homeostasis protein
MAILEIACFNTQSAIIAREAGASRLELCDNADLGGTTPPIEWLTKIRDGTDIDVPINVMIRPRGGDFVYTAQEFDTMKDSLNTFKSTAKVDGFVFGMVTNERTVDVDRTTELVSLAAPLPCTFHRAFDELEDLYQGLEDVLRCGIRTILTSGGESNAVQGREVLARLVNRAGDRVVIMPDGGVRSMNLELLHRDIQASAYHSSALIQPNTVVNAEEVSRMRAILL